MAAGQSVAYVSEAGTPLLADPGFQLSRAVRAEGLSVWAVPGPSALLAALAVAGLPTDRFHFAGFLPSAKTARRAGLRELRDGGGTLLLYDSTHRDRDTVSDICEVMEPERRVVLCRELTTKFEEVLSGTAATLHARLAEQPV